MSIEKQTPANIDQLVKDASCKYSWKTRLGALNELKKYDCQKSRDVILRLALHDKVYKVKEEVARLTADASSLRCQARDNLDTI